MKNRFYLLNSPAAQLPTSAYSSRTAKPEQQQQQQQQQHWH